MFFVQYSSTLQYTSYMTAACQRCGPDKPVIDRVNNHINQVTETDHPIHLVNTYKIFACGRPIFIKRWILTKSIYFWIFGALRCNFEAPGIDMEVPDITAIYLTSCLATWHMTFDFPESLWHDIATHVIRNLTLIMLDDFFLLFKIFGWDRMCFWSVL